MNTIINADMNEYWNGDGGKKWVGFHRSLNVGLKPFGEKAMDSALPSPHQSVIDIGCGCGDTSFELANRVGSTGSVLGLDISDVILQQARNRKTQLKTNNKINFECADAQSHHFTPQSYDLAFSRFGIMFFDNPEVAFKNIWQSLKPKGRFVFVCWQPVKSNQWVSLPLDVTAKHELVSSPTDPENPGPFSLGEPDRIRYLLSNSGFVDIEITPYEHRFNVGENIDEAASFLSKMGPASIVISEPDVDKLTVQRIIDEIRNDLEPYLTPQGVELNAATWIVTACR